MPENPESFNTDALGADRVAIARRMREAQGHAGLADHDVARAIGIREARWRDYKRGDVRVGVLRIPLIARTLGVSVPWLLYGRAADPDEVNPLGDPTRRDAMRAALEIAAAVGAVVQGADRLVVAGAPLPPFFADALADHLTDVATLVRRLRAPDAT